MLPVLTVVVAFGLDLLVQADREKIKAVIDAGIRAVEEENCTAIAQIISEDYSDSYHGTKKDLIHHCRLKLTPPLVAKNKKTGLLIDVSPPNATAILTVVIHFDRQSYIYKEYLRPLMITKTELHLHKQPDKRWLINRVELLEIDRQPADWQDIK